MSKRLTREDRAYLRERCDDSLDIHPADGEMMLDDLDTTEAELAEYRGALIDRTKERDDARWRDEQKRQEIERLRKALDEAYRRGYDEAMSRVRAFIDTHGEDEDPAS